MSNLPWLKIAAFEPSAFARLRVFGDFFRQEFQGDESLKACVFGFIDDPHPAAAEHFDDAVMGDGPANQRRSIRHVWEMLEAKLTGVNRGGSGFGGSF
ncbi:MAG: hypothetical protein WB985_13095 [Candidatus Acidiferrales bacterium]